MAPGVQNQNNKDNIWKCVQVKPLLLPQTQLKDNRAPVFAAHARTVLEMYQSKYVNARAIMGKGFDQRNMSNS